LWSSDLVEGFVLEPLEGICNPFFEIIVAFNALASAFVGVWASESILSVSWAHKLLARPH
jgi:hypothetical protein